MRKKSIILFALIVSACAAEVDKTPLPVDGSRADGSVVLGFSYSPVLEIPKIDWDAAQANAAKRCRAWGYSKADAFEGQATSCQRSDFYGNCLETVVRKTYQCTR